MSFAGAAVRTAAQMWEDNWDEEDQVDQQRQKQGKIKVTPQVMPQVSPLVETLDCWDDADEDTLVDSVQVKPAPVRAPEKDLKITEKLAETITAPSLPAVEVVTPKMMPAIQQRYWGKVRWFRGSQGWVTSDKVKTDRNVNPLANMRRSEDSSSEIRNALYLHKSECNFLPCWGMDVSFRVEADLVGSLKCVDVREESWTSFRLGVPQNQRITLDEHMEQISNPKPRETVSGDGTQKADKDSKAKPSSIAPKDDTQRWFKARMSKPVKVLKPVKLNPRNLELHSSASSTAPGSSSCNTSVASEVDVQSQASEVHVGERTLERAGADRPRHMHSSLWKLSRNVETEQPTVSRYVEIEEPTEETPSDNAPVAESWEDDVSEEDEVSEEALDQVDSKVTAGYIRRSEQKVDVEEPIKEPPVADSWDQPPVAAPNAESWEGDEVPECWCPKRPRQKLANQKLANPKTAPQEGRLAQFCEAMGPEFPFEFVARHLGTDFDAIVQSALDVHSLDSLVRGGMKPLHRNKLCKALRQEMAQRVTRRESPKRGLADFLAEIGPEFNSAFLAHNLGTDDLDEIITKFTDLDDLDVLVVAGMKPLLRNKLHRQLELERKRRAAEC